MKNERSISGGIKTAKCYCSLHFLQTFENVIQTFSSKEEFAK